MRIRATFLDEISHDIPHQNWGRREWDADFGHMRRAGIDTVVLIRCGYRDWLTYPSDRLMTDEAAFRPPVDLVRMFLELSEEHGMAFYLGLYDSGRYWVGGDYEREVEINLAVIDEAWARYGSSRAFAGWYLSQECSRAVPGIADLYARLGAGCKAVSGGLPVMISPYIDGPKAISQYATESSRDEGITVETHEREWDGIFAAIRGSVDIVAFQDGHVGFRELTSFLEANRRLADRHGMACWTNTESFDRDMPIKFPPIKWEKLLFKLEAADRAGIEHAITFEFSHFMSPQSAYPAAGHLYNRYMEYRDDGQAH